MWEDVEVVLCADESGRDGSEDSTGQEVWRLMSTKTRCPIKVYDDEERWEIGLPREEEEEEARKDCVVWEWPEKGLDVVFPRAIQNSHG